MYGELDFVAYKIKYGDEPPIADMNSTVSSVVSSIALIQINSQPLYITVKIDYVAPETFNSEAFVIPAM